jgi:hypothetical protein
MKNKSSTKLISWIRLAYKLYETGCQVHIETSDAVELIYHFVLENKIADCSEGNYNCR